MHRAGCVVVLQRQLSLGIRPRARTGIRHVVGSDDLRRHAATPFGPAWLVREGLPDQGKSGPLGSGFLDSSASKREPLPRPGI
jgi:hypothetical protein